MPPPAPASVPQLNVPLAHRSFCVELLQAERDAPYKVERVSPPVEEALVKKRVFETVRFVEEEFPMTLDDALRSDIVVVASVATLT